MNKLLLALIILLSLNSIAYDTHEDHHSGGPTAGLAEEPGAAPTAGSAASGWIGQLINACMADRRDS